VLKPDFFSTKLELVLLTFALVFAIEISAQNTKEDSLLQVIEITNDASVKLKTFLQLARTKDFSYFEKSVKYYTKALEFETDKYNGAAILDTIGLYNWQLGNYKEGLKYFNESLILFEELKDSLWLGRLYNNIAVVNYGLGNRNEALNNYQKGLKIREAINDKRGLTNIYNNIGIIYQDWGLYNDALKWHENALKIAMEINDIGTISYSYSNIGSYHEHIENYNEALKNYFLGYNYLTVEFSDNQSNSFFCTNIGKVYSKINKLDSALFYYQKALEFAITTNNKNRIAIAQYYLGKTYIKLKKVEEAQFVCLCRN